MKEQTIRKTHLQTAGNAIGKIAFATLSFGLAAVLAHSPAFAQGVSETTSTLATPIPVSRHAPMRLHAAPSGDGTVSSDNWSGYAVTGTNFTYAKGSWHVPQVDCTTTPNSQSAFWVGIDGFSDKTVEQTGTASNCNGTTPEYFVWYEFYPANPVVITSIPIAAGDTMGASITYSDGKFTIGIDNRTTGKEFHITRAVSGAERTSAEWIAEAPSVNGVPVPLSDFVRVSFGEDYTSDPDSNYATDSAVNDGPIIDFGSDVQEITMFSNTGVAEAVPTALTADGTSFRVKWKSE
jgi:hypothetical protein